MTDTLRGECSELLSQLIQCVDSTGGYFYNTEKAMNIAMAFARAHQAAGLREAAKQLREVGDRAYCRGSDIFNRHCKGMQVIERFEKDVQQEKIRQYGLGERQSGTYFALHEQAQYLEAQATARERGA